MVVSGTVLESFTFTREGDGEVRIGEHLSESFSGTWFYTSRDADECRHFGPEASVQLVLDATCCDVLPPGDAPCFLGVGEAQPVSDQLRGLLPQ